jgi:hypothetical protein
MFLSNSLKYDTSLPCLDSRAAVPYAQHKNQTLPCSMNTFTDLPASHKCPQNNGGDSVMDAMMGLQQSFAGAMMPVA